MIFDPNGQAHGESGLRAAEHFGAGGIMMSPSDLQDLQHGYPFVLTTEDVPEYDVKYVGRQKVDEVDCYVFDVSPKTIEKGKRYLDGRIWVDTTDLQIVVTDGRMVPDDTRKNHEDLHPPFMTWRQQIDGHYWFPVYTKGEGILHFSGGYGYMAQDVHIRDTDQIHRLQALRFDEQGVLQRAGDHEQRATTESPAKHSTQIASRSKNIEGCAAIAAASRRVTRMIRDAARSAVSQATDAAARMIYLSCDGRL